MASIFFPEPMERVEISSPLQSAYYAVKLIAEHSHVQFEDQNSGQLAVNKRYQETFMQCEEAERSLRFIKGVLENYKLLPESPTVAEFHTRVNLDFKLAEMLEEIALTDTQLHEKTVIYSRLQKQLAKRKRKLEALKFFRPFIESQVSHRNRDLEESSSIELSILGNANMIMSVTGFVHNSKVRSLITTACRATRRNITPIIGEANGDFTPYTLFVSSPDMLLMLTKICESFGPDVFELSPSAEQLDLEEQALTADIDQMQAVERQTFQANNEFIVEVSQRYWDWTLNIAREKQIYMAMDFGTYTDQTVIFHGWCPKRFIDEIHTILGQATNMSSSPIQIQMNHRPAEECPELTPPTFIETNSFNGAFQMLNDSYGIPSYNEINGGAFYGMYPFLFGIMFGDIGHAFIYLLITAVVFAIEFSFKRSGARVPSMLTMAFKLKWLLLFCSLAAFYCGFLYNEIFGLPIDIFGSKYIVDRITGNKKEWKQKDASVYPFGMDPIWMFKDNELVFLNSYKMKVSIIMGMSQMVFGMILSLINHIHRKDWKGILLGWVPEILYLIPFFGYLVFAILKKWCTHFQGNPQFNQHVQDNGVNLIQMQISMILNMGKKDEDLQLYPEQWTVHTIIVSLFIISIPLLLFLQPIINCVKTYGTPEFNILEIFVMNLIHVIEFCLSALSHLASYLRLWALSLAHSQLSHVIYEEVFVLTMNLNGFMSVAGTFIGVAAFVVLTIAILLGMEAFSALLHAIRLMWVEFSSKFYEGMGLPWTPLSLKALMEDLLDN